MYYLAQFCRICIQTDVKLVDIESVDTDSIKISRKLAECTKMVINRESLSTNICIHCVKKLRISYEFHNMCKKSSDLLQGLLSELISNSNKVSADNFTNSEIRVTLSPIHKINPHQVRKRITKAERCSILKSLLSNNDNNNNNNDDDIEDELKNGVNALETSSKGGLRNIINFTRSFNFGFKYKLDNHDCESTPLEKLNEFSKNFFKQDFADFRNTILYIIENNHVTNDSEDEDIFEDCSEDMMKEIKFEEVVIEPDIKIKSEIMYDEVEENIDCASEYVETSYSELECRQEASNYSDTIFVKEECSFLTEPFSNFNSDNSMNNNLIFPSNTTMDMLTDLVGSVDHRLDHRKTFSPNSVRCRTRGNPYINPRLKEQFMLRSFQCKECPRYFKTPGYLKAHIAKVHHSLH